MIIKFYNKFIKFYNLILYVLIYKPNYKFDIFLNKQEKLFDKHNLNRKKAIEKLNFIKKSYPFVDNLMASEHQLIFSAISRNETYKIKKILEIGTYDGINSFLLSQLFPSAKIETIDLDEADDKFKNFYNRPKNFVFNRDEILKKSSNIFFFKKNSLNLIFDNNKYDLIWIDGAHGYPVVCIDIINSINLINENGIILCDDIYSNKIKNADEMFRSHASHETLSALKKENIIDFDLFYKRLDSKNNSVEKSRKFVGIIKKNNFS